MEVFYVLVFVAAICISILIDRLFRSRNVNADGMEIPGPDPWPLIGNMFEVNIRGLHLSFSRMAELYGTIFRVKLFGRNIVIINDVDLERKAFASTEYGDVFNDRYYSFFGKYVLFGSDIVFVDGTKKTMIKRKMFHRSLKFYGDGIPHFNRMNEDELMNVLKRLKLTKQCDFDLHALLWKSLANTIARLINGACPTDDDRKAIMEVAEAGGYFASGAGFIYDFIPMIRFLPGFFSNRYRKTIAARDQLLDKFYFSERGENKSEGKQGLVQTLIRMQKEINQKAGTDYITEEDMKGIITDVYGASQETTSAVLTNAFAIMLTHREVAKKIQKEIDMFVEPSRLPNETDKPHMHYTMATVYEVLRYTSPLALCVPHRSSKDINFEGYFVPKDSVILPNHWHIHHDPKLWHEPWAFKPERFLDDGGMLLPPENQARRNVMAFSTGRRECPGENFAKSRVFFYLTAVLQSFDIVAASDGQLPETDPRNYELRGIDVQVKPHLCRVIPRDIAK